MEEQMVYQNPFSHKNKIKI